MAVAVVPAPTANKKAQARQYQSCAGAGPAGNYMSVCLQVGRRIRERLFVSAGSLLLPHEVSAKPLPAHVETVEAQLEGLTHKR